MESSLSWVYWERQHEKAATKNMEKVIAKSAAMDRIEVKVSIDRPTDLTPDCGWMKVRLSQLSLLKVVSLLF